MKRFTSTDPWSGETVAVHEAHDDRDLQRRLDRAEKAFESWKREPIENRCERIRALEILFRVNLVELARDGIQAFVNRKTVVVG